MPKKPSKNPLSTFDIAAIGIFSALLVVMNLILGPLSFQLMGLPVLHDFGVFFTLLLTAWVTRKFGPSLLVGIIGSVIAILLGGPILILGFAASALIFDALMVANHHKIDTSKFSLAIASLVTLISAYVAGAVIGVFFMPNGAWWSLTIWGGWHLVGGVIAIGITLPVILSLEKANIIQHRG